MNAHPMNAMTRRMEEAAEWLIRLQEDDLPESEIVRWVEWCEIDPENRRTFERLMPLWQALDPVQTPATQAVRLPCDAAESLTDRREQFKGESHRRPVWARVNLGSALAAGVALAIGAWALWKITATGPESVAEVASVDSASAQHRELTLPDGSALELGARSAVTIDFKGLQRHIELGEGQAFFTVKHDKSRPFVVVAGDLQVVAVGTAFDVLRTGDRVTVTVQEGIVEVSANALTRATHVPGEAQQPLRAPAGYQIVYDATQRASPTLRMVDAAAATAWREGRLEYISEPLTAVIANLNRYAPYPIVLQGAALDRLNYTGTIEVRSIDEWLLALPHIFPVQVQADADRTVVIKAQRVE